MADWTLNEDASLPILRKAVEAGINFFDTADIYSRGQSEEILGRGLKELGVRRDESVVATKVFIPMGRGPNRGGLSKKHILQSIDASLTRSTTMSTSTRSRFDLSPIEETSERWTTGEVGQGALHRRQLDVRLPVLQIPERADATGAPASP